MALAMRWLIESARKRGENTMTRKLAAELLDASKNRGSAVKKREDTHKMAEANKRLQPLPLVSGPFKAPSGALISVTIKRGRSRRPPKGGIRAV